MPKAANGRTRVDRTNYCTELSYEAQCLIRSTSLETGLPQYEVLERLVRCLSQPVVKVALEGKCKS